MTERAKAFQRAFVSLKPTVPADVREELARARAALGHSARHVGHAASLAWQTLITPVRDRLDAGPPGTLKRRIGLGLLCLNFKDWTHAVLRRLQGCDCDSRNPAVCSGADSIEYWHQEYTWCFCPLCHGPAVVGIGEMAVAGD